LALIDKSEGATAADPSGNSASDVSAAALNRYRQALKDYRDRQTLGKAKRKADDLALRKISAQLARPNRGWTPISDRERNSENPEEEQRARKARNKRDQRARLAKSVRLAPSTVALTITHQEFTDRLARLQRWLALPDHRPRHLRDRTADIMRAWVLRRDCMGRYGREPTLAEFADTFVARFEQPMTRQMAQRRLALLAVLEAAGGPFGPAF
jgi:hypothetical protein